MSVARIARNMMLSTSERFSPRATEEILNKLAFTPERKSLLANPDFRELIKDPNLERGYIFGSTASKKPNPTDLDFYGITKGLSPESPRFEAEARYDKIGEILDKQQELRNINKEGTLDAHLVEIPHPDDWGAWHDASYYDAGEGFIKDVLKEGRKRYGADYKWKRILGASGVALPSLGSFQPETHNE